MKTISGTLSLRFLFFLFLFSPALVLAQEAVESTEVLVLTNAEKNKTFLIKSAKHVKVWFNQNEKLKGCIKDISNDSILIDNQLIGINQITKIRINKTGAKIVGGTITFGGLLVTACGIATLASAQSASGCLGPAMATLVGIIITATGGAVVLIGLPILLIGKKFDMSKGWQISTAMVSD